MAMKTDFGKKYVMKLMRGFHLVQQRLGHAHQVVNNRAILRALAGGVSVLTVAKSFGVPKARVRRLAKRYAAQGGPPPTGTGGAVTWTRRHGKGGSMAVPSPQGGTVGLEMHGSVIDPA